MRTSAPLSWKGLTLSAAFHGVAFVAAGWILLEPAEVGVKEAPVTAEFQMLADVPSISTPTLDAVPVEGSRDTTETPDEMTEADRVGEMPREEIPAETGIPLPVASKQPLGDPIPAGSPSIVASSRSPRVPHRSAPHHSAVAHRGATDVLPDYLNNPPPQYPESSRLAGEQGAVLVRAEVSSSGQVNRVSLAHSSGYPPLDRAALEAVALWKFRPASAAGISMDSEVAVPVRFELHDGANRNP